MNFNHDLGSIDTILSIDTSQSPPLGGTTNTLTITGTGAIRVPVGNTAARPANATGWLRYNSETVGLEYNTGSGWFTVANTAGGGGTVTSVAVSGSTGLTVGGSPQSRRGSQHDITSIRSNLTIASCG